MAARNLAVIRMPAGIMLCHYFFECSLLGRAQQAADAQLALIQEGLYLRACFPADLADILMGFVDNRPDLFMLLVIKAKIFCEPFQ